jgi:hypothetical protein
MPPALLIFFFFGGSAPAVPFNPAWALQANTTVGVAVGPH